MLAMQPLHQLKNGHCVSLVEISGGFIGQQKGRLLNERAGDRHALLLPPDNSPARCLTRAPRPTSLSQRSEVSSASSYPAPRISSGIATFSAAVKSAKRWCLCHTKPIDRVAIIRKLIFPKRIYRFPFEVYCTACWRV